MFEPFFTTKEHGTGLGLATSYGIIKENGGDLRVDSTPGQGTTFRIELPVTEQTPEEMESPAEKRAPRGTETILLVEDEDPVRRVVETMLKRHGYQVLASASSEDALAAAEQHRGEIHLLITDIMMPGMSGRKMAECLTAQRPDDEGAVCFRLRRRQGPRTTCTFCRSPSLPKSWPPRSAKCSSDFRSASVPFSAVGTARHSVSAWDGGKRFAWRTGKRLARGGERGGLRAHLRTGAPAGGPSGLSNRPRPFVIRCAALNGRVVHAGEGFCFGLHLFDVRAIRLWNTSRALSRNGRT